METTAKKIAREKKKKKASIEENRASPAPSCLQWPTGHSCMRREP
jgi:hypothetical protein